jgi:hypothetical protein
MKEMQTFLFFIGTSLMTRVIVYTSSPLHK